MMYVPSLMLLGFLVGVAAAAAPQAKPTPLQVLLSQGVLEKSVGSNEVTHAVAAYQGTLIRGFQARNGEGLKLYAVFRSPLTEQQIAGQIKADAHWVEANGRPYDPSAPHLPALCYIQHDKESTQTLRDFVRDALKSCKRYYSVSGAHRVWKTLYVEEGPDGQKIYHLFHGFTFE